MLRRLLLSLLYFCTLDLASAAPVISEFMASNQNSITDENGDHSDWIEIRNPDATAVNLNGWFLTDSASNKSKWMFPAVTVPANGYLIVWASSKNRRLVGSPLHTNFSLSNNGEYLALVMPNGLTVTTEFSPTFPEQFGDISYGTATAPDPAPVGYFKTATPGLANGGPATLQLPQKVTPSRVSGTFTANFSLALTGNAVGQEIRYVLSAPGGGVTLGEPTAASTLYTGPVSITGSTLIRAAVFSPSNGQKGVTTTFEYLKLETTVGANNTSNFTSNLPIIVADNHGAGSPVDSGSGTYTPAVFHIFEPVNGVASLAATPTLSTRAGFRIRGSSSQGFAKKSYGLEFWDEQNLDLDQPLAGLASDSDWILNGPFLYDDTFIHNAYSYEISRRMGRWAPRTRFVEMFTNTNGGLLDYSDYAGVYVLTEKIKSNKDRLDINSISPADITNPAVTGGYIFKIDRVDGNEVSWKTTSGVPGGDPLVIVEPDPDFDTPEQIAYLKDYVQQFDTTLLNEKNAGFTTRNYRNYIDTGAWVDHHIINSLTYNVDAFRLSAFFFKDRAKKIQAGPMWDLDRALNSDDGRDDNPASWSSIEYFYTNDWWGRLFLDPDFVQAWVDRWWQLRAPGGALETSALNALADQQGAEIGNAAGARDAAKWTENAARAGVYLNEITDMKTWLASRLSFLDSQMPAPPLANVPSGVVAAGTTVTVTGSNGMRYTVNGLDRAPRVAVPPRFPPPSPTRRRFPSIKPPLSPSGSGFPISRSRLPPRGSFGAPRSFASIW